MTGYVIPSSWQQNLAAATAGLSPDTFPHHPITCFGKLEVTDDGGLECEHVAVPRSDERLQACLNHTVAALIIEMAARL